MSDPNTDQNPYGNGELPADADLNDETTGEATGATNSEADDDSTDEGITANGPLP